MKNSMICRKSLVLVAVILGMNFMLYAQSGTTSSSRLHNLIVAEGDHTLMNEQGVVWSWGSNSNGQLGDGTTTDRSVPVQAGFPWGPMSSIIGMAAGKTHSFALEADGTVWSWGANGYGQLGDATYTERTTVVQVKGSGGTGTLSGISTIQGGDFHSLALKHDGTVWGWGRNNYGQLGDNSTTNRTSPVQVLGSGGSGNLTNVKAIVGGGLFSLALKDDGTVWGWGRNDKGQLGDNSTTDRSTPVQVKGAGGTGNLADVVAIHAGYGFSLALKADGTVWAWGSNTHGQLGDNTSNDSSVPVQVKGAGGSGNLTNVTKLSGGAQHGLVIKGDGTVWAWGRNQFGQLGDNSTTNRITPVQVSNLSNAVQVAGGYYHSAVFKSDGTVWTWGYNLNGQLGDYSTTDRTTPVLAAGLTGVIQISAGYDHSFALRSDGTLRSWGSNSFFELGNGRRGDSEKPVQVVNLFSVKKSRAGSSHSLAIKSDGTVWTWGYNFYGQLGDNSTTDKKNPVQVASLTDVIRLSSREHHNLALKTDGTVWAWGLNYGGQLGDGTTTDRTSPVQVSNLTNIIDIAAGLSHSIVLKSDGTVWAWGSNYNGSLGDGTTTARLTPVQVSNLTNIVAITTGYFHNLSLKFDGTVWAWGDNSEGQLGDNSTTFRTTPIQVSGLSGVVAINAGTYHSHAIKSDGAVSAWGANSKGELGDGTNTDRYTATDVNNVSNALEIASGYFHSLLATSNWDVFGTGDNTHGQLGDGSKTDRNTYTATVGLKANSGEPPVDDSEDESSEEGQTPKDFALYQNYPNPFNPSTIIKFALPNDRLVTLQVFDTQGSVVARLYFNKRLKAGTHEVSFTGKGLPTGAYIYRLTTFTEDGTKEVKSRKMLLIK